MKTPAVRGFFAAVAAVVLAATPLVGQGVTINLDQVKQRYPWNGLVDIDYTVTLGQDEEFGVDDAIEVLMVNKDVKPAVTNRASAFLQFAPPLTAGRHRITWDANADGVTNRIAKAEFLLDIIHYTVNYMVIDVSEGPGAEEYHVDFINGTPQDNFNTDEYKGDKIVLRRIHPGYFIAGSPTDEANRMVYYKTEREELHRVVLTKPFYIGVFEITQQQWLNVMGEPNPAKYQGSYRPVETVAYTRVRGGNWPTTIEPDADTFMDKLLMKCKAKDADGNYTIPVKGFDLPTEHQWEYACRAGTTKGINLTDNFDNTQSASQIAQLELAGRYKDNQTKGAGGFTANHTKVGSYAPNAWGLYDMLGNVFEWCRDWYAINPATLQQYVDPKGPDKSEDPGRQNRSFRVARGGSWGNTVDGCRSAVRNEVFPIETNANEYHGFRLCRTLP